LRLTVRVRELWRHVCGTARKQLATALKLMPTMGGVVAPMVSQHLHAEKNFVSNDLIDASAKGTLDELFKWAPALKPLRASSG
jgi:hypothetical protein